MIKRSIAIAVVAVFILALTTVALAADDPFTGTWREVQPKAGDSKPLHLILTPNSDGITIQANDGGKPNVLHFGKDYPSEDGTTWNTVRIDGHTLKSTFTQNGKTIINETATASSDGKHYTRIRENVATESKQTLEYDRVGPVPAGDAFFGTWQQKQRGPRIYTLKVDVESFDWSRDGSHMLTAKFDGKAYKQENANLTAKLQRVNASTIEMVQKTGNDPRTGTTLWQVKGNTLITTFSVNGAQGQPTITSFERVK